MAWRWRIRHKLMVGLALVVGILALQEAGTLKGLVSYSGTMKRIDSKVAELTAVNEFKNQLAVLVVQEQDEEIAHLEQKMAGAQSALHEYELRLRETLLRNRDPDKGFLEGELLKELHKGFENLSRAIEEVKAPQFTTQRPLKSLVLDSRIQAAFGHLLRASDELRLAVVEDLYRCISDAKVDYRRTMTLSVTVSIVGVLLMVGMLSSFYRWVFYPIRDLAIGAGRVAHGDFEHRIDVKSGDEMEDMADAFNNMTGRLRDMYSDLAHQVNERSRQLVRSERLASVGFLAAGVAHEINNPLASIAFCSEALESRLDDVLRKAPADSETITKYLRMIQQEAFRCKDITQRLLEFSRGGEPRREPTDLTELVQSVLDMVQHLQNGKGKRIVFDARRTLVAWINGQEVKSVVLNLVVNALDSMDEGGTLTIELRERDRQAELIFADSGCGMTQEVLENIFEPFYTRSRTGKGTGLGLSISHRIITQHGGEIGADSAGPGCGSTFTVTLPLRPAENFKEETLGNAAA